MKSNEEHEERFDDEYQNKNLIAQEDITSSEDDTSNHCNFLCAITTFISD